MTLLSTHLVPLFIRYQSLDLVGITLIIIPRYHLAFLMVRNPRLNLPMDANSLMITLALSV